MLKNKKSEIPWIKLIVILLITGIILITFIITLSELNNFQIEDKKLRTKIVINNILDSKCFSEKFATIEKDKFIVENLNLCLKGLDKNTLVRVILKNKDLYYDLNYDLNQDRSKEEFEYKKNFCGLTKSNILCTKIKFPVIFIENNVYKNEFLTLQIIA